jgi:hypothetical protein
MTMDWELFQDGAYAKVTHQSTALPFPLSALADPVVPGGLGGLPLPSTGGVSEGPSTSIGCDDGPGVGSIVMYE